MNRLKSFIVRACAIIATGLATVMNAKADLAADLTTDFTAATTQLETLQTAILTAAFTFVVAGLVYKMFRGGSKAIAPK